MDSSFRGYPRLYRITTYRSRRPLKSIKQQSHSRNDILSSRAVCTIKTGFNTERHGLYYEITSLVSPSVLPQVLVLLVTRTTRSNGNRGVTHFPFQGNVILSLFRDPFLIEPPESGTR